MESDAKADERAFFEAKRMVEEALATGTCTDLRLFEATVSLQADSSFDKPKQVQLLLDAVRFLYVSGNVERGLSMAQRARRLAVEVADVSLSVDALMYYGICAADTGGLAEAMEAYSDALRLAQSNDDKKREAKLWTNLGAALLYSGLYKEAVECFKQNIELATLNPSLDVDCTSSSTNIALCYLNLDEPEQALLSIKQAIAHFPSHESQQSPLQLLNRALLENYYTRVLIELEDFEGAKARAQIARRLSLVSKLPRADITAAVAEGLAQVFSGQPDIGITLLTRTLERARSLKVATREVLVAIVKAHEHIGQHDKALEYLKQMLTSQKETQEANVLKHVERHLAQLHLKDGQTPIEDSKQAMKRLRTKQEVLEGRIAKRELFRQSVEGLERLAVATELRDDSTGEHSYRVGRMSSLLAKEAGCDEEMVFMIDIAARLHDIGKIAIPDGILLKPSSFNPSERIIMEMHAEAGADVLAKSNIPQIQMAEEIARYHHEKWDGTGYPHGLAGEAIPLAARIAALADVFDALTHVRPYKMAWTVDSALTEILSLSGKHFDPHLTKLFLGLVSRLVREGVDLDDMLGEAARKSSFNQAKGKIWDSLKLAKEEYQAKIARTLDLQR